MNMNFEFDLFNVIILIINIALIAIYALNSIKLTKLRKNYSDFMTKLGKGNNINEMLQEYVKSVDEIKKENNEIERYCQKLDTDSKNYLKKIGLVRYNAYKDTGSNLSFALAILNEHNTGIVLNGIYGRDTSNTVSYTHLDVYKRQDVYGTNNVYIDCFYSSFGTSVILVSK